MTRIARIAAAGGILLAVGACADTDPTLRRAGLGAAGGAAAGGLIGSLSGNFGWGALIGAGAGAAGGLLYDYHRRSVDDAYRRGQQSPTR
ncbi:YMGG-like glycine zipper-containing protein [Elioraea sp.]|jgi:uncharacterized membrane protein|uniref:YMGG-like glycine zipper-containing protein n=1 Tax=Elioraea sp. TaxID=2185103 RepID=UPI0021DC2735|nr:YMGG-like glycine zipper-containing protein [Elioraea sp.]GIX10017.1 MAG: hypothetical protein KatS3mg116_1727 [Elioraea sp.]